MIGVEKYGCQTLRLWCRGERVPRGAGGGAHGIPPRGRIITGAARSAGNDGTVPGAEDEGARFQWGRDGANRRIIQDAASRSRGAQSRAGEWRCDQISFLATFSPLHKAEEEPWHTFA